MTSDFTRLIVNCTDLNDDFCLACADTGMVAIMVEMSEELTTCVPNVAEDEVSQPHRNQENYSSIPTELGANAV